MKETSRICLAMGAGVAVFLLFGYTHSQSYCFFYLSIDTMYAPGFSDAAFSQISNGMTMPAVQQKMGTPLSIQTVGNKQIWFYTLDGKCFWGDWAWIGRKVKFQDGIVIEVIKDVYYN